MYTPGLWSRYRLCDGLFDADGMLYLSMPEPFVYRELPDTLEYTVKEGDTLFTIASRAYETLKSAPGLIRKGVGNLYWVIADFQPDPRPDACFDPTLRLIAGTKLFVPSARVVQEQILSEARRIEYEG